MKTKTLDNGVTLEVGKRYRLAGWHEEGDYEVVKELEKDNWIGIDGIKWDYEHNWQPYEEEKEHYQPNGTIYGTPIINKIGLLKDEQPLPVNIHVGLSNISVEQIDGVIHVKPNKEEQPLPKYGDTVFVKCNKKWRKYTTIGIINGKCAVLSNDYKLYEFSQGDYCFIALYEEYRLTDPSLDKQTPTMTLDEALKELARLKGVDGINLKD